MGESKQVYMGIESRRKRKLRKLVIFIYLCGRV